jgi:hypothetical protein
MLIAECYVGKNAPSSNSAPHYAQKKGKTPKMPVMVIFEG